MQYFANYFSEALGNRVGQPGADVGLLIHVSFPIAAWQKIRRRSVGSSPRLTRYVTPPTSASSPRRIRRSIRMNRCMGKKAKHDYGTARSTKSARFGTLQCGSTADGSSAPASARTSRPLAIFGMNSWASAAAVSLWSPASGRAARAVHRLCASPTQERLHHRGASSRRTCSPVFGHLPCDKLTVPHPLNYRERRKDKDTTINRELSYFHAHGRAAWPCRSHHSPRPARITRGRASSTSLSSRSSSTSCRA
jgi:hypothetical protein